MVDVQRSRCMPVVRTLRTPESMPARRAVQQLADIRAPHDAAAPCAHAIARKANERDRHGFEQPRRIEDSRAPAGLDELHRNDPGRTQNCDCGEYALARNRCFSRRVPSIDSPDPPDHRESECNRREAEKGHRESGSGRFRRSECRTHEKRRNRSIRQQGVEKGGCKEHPEDDCSPERSPHAHLMVRRVTIADRRTSRCAPGHPPRRPRVRLIAAADTRLSGTRGRRRFAAKGWRSRPSRDGRAPTLEALVTARFPMVVPTLAERGASESREAVGAASRAASRSSP